MRKLNDKVTIYEFRGTFEDALREAAEFSAVIGRTTDDYVINVTADFQDDGSWYVHLFVGSNAE